MKSSRNQLFCKGLSNQDCSYNYNKDLPRYNWLKLTPAYSAKLVQEVLSQSSIRKGNLLDPFAGSGTTGLVAANYGYSVDLLELNPFLVWLLKAKREQTNSLVLRNYFSDSSFFINEVEKLRHSNLSIPLYKNIKKWWSDETITCLAALKSVLVNIFGVPQLTKTLIPWVAYFQTIQNTLNIKKGHISLTASKSNICAKFTFDLIIEGYLSNVFKLLSEPQEKSLKNITVYCNDSRELVVGCKKYDLVITSPPYANRVSYIRELRPYMYWGGFLESSEDAGYLDWQAIGGTWGVATRKLKNWLPERVEVDCFAQKYYTLISSKKNNYASLLGQYVRKYFYDMYLHFEALSKKLVTNAEIYYIVGNSSFYGVLLPTELIFKDILASLGFKDILVKIVRKRNYNKCLYEYCVSARWK